MKLLHQISILLVAIALSSSVFGQNLVIGGNLTYCKSVKHCDKVKKLKSCQVIVFRNGEQIMAFDSGKAGKYKIRLELGYTYDLLVSKDGYLPKIVRINTENIPEEEKVIGFQMDLPFYLFTMVEGFNLEITNEPIAKYYFDTESGTLVSDFAYTQMMKARIDAEFKRLEQKTTEQ